MRLEDLGDYSFTLFYLHLAGWEEAQKDAWRRTCTLAAILINANSKKKVTPQQLMGEDKLDGPTFLTHESFKAFMRNRIKEAQEAEEQDSEDDALLSDTLMLEDLNIL